MEFCIGAVFGILPQVSCGCGESATEPEILDRFRAHWNTMKWEWFRSYYHSCSICVCLKQLLTNFNDILEIWEV